MDRRYRTLFNRSYTPALYERMCALMDERLATPRFEFRLAETPLFLPPDLRARCVRVAREVLELLKRPSLIAACDAAVPDRFRAPRMDALPHFLAIDLAIVRGASGELEPRLIELQGFSSLYGMQLVQGEVWGGVVSSMPGMPGSFTPCFSGLDHDGYVSLLRRTVIADCEPDDVVLLDVDPASQKTRPDFHATARLLGVRSVCVTDVVREGRRLLAPKDGKLIPVRRILHRVVFDELERKKVEMRFDYRDDLDVVWAAHPNWYWVWSKYTLPFLDHPALPPTRFLSDVTRVPDDLSRYILKPVFSFAGQGVQVDLDRSILDRIPPAERKGWILQEKVDYAPALTTPDGTGVKAEIRMMFLRPEDSSDLELAVNLVRLSRGKMHGVDHNKGLSWVGSSVAIWPSDEKAPPLTKS